MKKSNILKCCFLSILFAMLMPVFASADLGDNDPKIFWNGQDPFHQPFSTTNYYGSGDITLDGTVNAADISAMQEIINGTRTANIRADVNGDGNFNTDDLSLLNNAVNNQGILPGWWNSLTTRQAREDWVMKMMALDKTDYYPYASTYICISFSVQTALDFAYSRWDTDWSFYSGGQTVYNLPMYTINAVVPNGVGHAFNAILTGDNPLNFDDWMFLEPQCDMILRPVIPDGGSVVITNMTAIHKTSFFGSKQVVFKDTISGIVPDSYSPDLILARPTVSANPVLNTVDRWNPKILKKDNGYLMFEQMRDDLSRTTDIHITPMPYTASTAPMPATGSDFASHLIDTCVASDGTTHVIWNSTYIEPGIDIDHRTRHQGVYYGTLNPATGTISNKTWVADTYYAVLSGRILCAPDGTIHVLVYDEKNGSINWYKKNGSSWSTSTKVVENVSFLFNAYRAIKDVRAPDKYLCDAAVTANSEIVLSWIGVDRANNTNTILYKKYSPSTNTWGSPAAVYSASGNVKPAGISMAWDGSNIQLAFWNGGDASDWANYYRGNVYVTTLNNDTWSAPLCLDNSGQATNTRITSDGNGKSCVVWDRRIDTVAKPVYSIKTGSGNWETPVQVAVRTGAEAFYPQAAFTENNSLYLCWSSRSLETIEIETYRVPSYNSFDSNNSQTKPPVLYYDFDQGRPLDMSGSNNNGTFNQGLVSSSVAGMRNSAVLLSDTYHITTPDSNSLNFGTGDLSISCWVRTTANYAKLINKKSSTGVGFSLEIYNGVPLMQISDPEHGVFNYFNLGIPNINNNVWHLITVTVDRDSSTGVKIYVDGILKVTGNALYRTGNISNTGILKIGTDTSGTNYQGELDELRLYNRTLTNSEIQTLYSDFYNIVKLSFDGNLSDISGNGSSVDSSFALFTTGAKNNALNSNAGNTATIAHNPTQNLGTGDFSFAFWMKRAGTPDSVETIIDKFDYTAYKGYSVLITNSEIRLLVAESNNSNMSYHFSGSFMNTLYDNQYHHIALTVDRDLGIGGVKLYIDGVLAWQYSSQGIIATINASNTQSLLVGIDHTYEQKYKGSLDELSIYTKVLTPAEITSKFNEGN